MRFVVFIGAIFLSLQLFAQGETFTIVKVKGEILNKTAGSSLHAGAVINADDQLEFVTQQSEAIAISSSRGKFVIKLPPDDLFGATSSLASVDNAAAPIAAHSQYSVRSLDTRISDFADYLGKETFYIIGNSVDLSFSSSVYPLSDQKFFSITYPDLGNEVTVDLLPNGQNVQLDKEKVFSGNQRVEKVSFYHLDATSGAIEQLTTVTVEFVEKDVLRKEFNVVKSAVSNAGLDVKATNKYLKQYFIDVYGKTDMDALQAFIREL